MKQVLVLFFVLALFILATVLNAQTTGSFKGSVVDRQGEGIPGATVRVLGTSQGAATNGEGEFHIAGLKVGEYKVEVTALISADKVVRTISITANTTSQESFELDVVCGEVLSCPILPCSYNPIRLVDPNTTGKITELSREELLR